MSAHQEKIILLDFMYSGDYLDDNIGHEIINLNQSDSKENFVYLCKDGTFNTSTYKASDIAHIVFLRRSEIHHRMEVLGFTEGPLEYVPTSDPRQWSTQYGGVNLGNIFCHNSRQQNVNITFKAQKVYRSNASFYIDEADYPHSTFFHASQTLRRYIPEGGKDYADLKGIISQLKGNCQPIVPLDIQEDCQITFMEIYGVLHRELSFSSALKYFIDKYSVALTPYFEKLAASAGKPANLGAYIRTLREYKNMDLVVEFEKVVFVIENKIFSKLNGVTSKGTADEKTQLDTYVGKMNDDKDFQQKEKCYILLTPDHNLLKCNNPWVLTLYSQLYPYLVKLAQQTSDVYLSDFVRSVSYHIGKDFNFTVMKKRFSRVVSAMQHRAVNPIKNI